jgi:3-dehydrotetronate 4-kinase
MRLGAIADDVTGGTDLASVLRRSGARVVQTLGLPRLAPPPADAVVVSLKTRTVPAGEAQSASAAAGAFLMESGAAQLYFKYCSTFDSTDAGNIGPVIETLLEKLDVPFTIACPAYPTYERTVYLGHLFVGDRLISDSSMRHHPLTPMTDPNLVQVLTRQCEKPIGLVPLGDVEAGVAATRARFDALEATGHRVAIVDAIFDRHLDVIGSAAEHLRLVTGGAALGGALIRATQGARPRGVPLQAFPSVTPPVAVLSGSCSAATLVQVERLAKVIPAHAVDPMELAENPSALDDLVAWARHHARRERSLLLFSSAAPDAVQKAQVRLGRADAAVLIETAFQRLAIALADCGVRTFVVAGGETSGAILTALDIRMFGFGEEVDPGVPWTFSLDPEGYALALKSGNFGTPDFFLKALEVAA